MNFVKTPILPSASEPQSHRAGGANSMAGGASTPSRHRTLSQGRVDDLITELIGRRFYGKLALHFEAGHIVCAKLEQSIKE